MRRLLTWVALLGLAAGFAAGTTSRRPVVHAARHDPTTRPEPGDVVRTPSGRERHVVAVLPDGYIIYRDEHGRAHHCHGPRWRRWCREKGAKGP